MLLCEGVAKSFYDPGRGPVHAVRDLDLTSEEGVVALLGANGAGKSTLLRLLATLLVPDRGRLRIFGLDPARDPVGIRRRLGYLATGTRCYPKLTARELLLYTGGFYDLDRKHCRRRIADLTEEFGLGAFLDQRCEGLSTGQRQRVKLARALLTRPELLILDEPTTGLDIVAARQVIDTVLVAARPGRLILFCTHIVHEVEAVARRVLILRDGLLVYDGGVEGLRVDGNLETGIRRHIPDPGGDAP